MRLVSQGSVNVSERPDRMFQSPVPTAMVIEGVHAGQFVPPTIEREFLWGPPQIRALFDGLKRGHSIGILCSRR